MLKIFSLNIEGDNHFDQIKKVIEQRQPDVLCLQEVFEQDLEKMQSEWGYPEAVFAPMANLDQENPYRLATKGLWGVAILSRVEIDNSEFRYYVKHGEGVPDFIIGQPNSTDRVVMWVDVFHQDQRYRIATTHLTWTPEGTVTPEQTRDVNELFKITQDLGEHVICGDFNAPRGKQTFDTIAQKYSDNIPTEVQTTLDNALHRAGDVLQPLVVDGFFTTEKMMAKNVEVISGVSDHMGIYGEVEISDEKSGEIG